MAGMKSYPACQLLPLRTVGLLLWATGLMMLFVSIPCWAWWALLGLGLIVLGFVVLKLSNAWG